MGTSRRTNQPPAFEYTLGSARLGPTRSEPQATGTLRAEGSTRTPKRRARPSILAVCQQRTARAPLDVRRDRRFHLEGARGHRPVAPEAREASHQRGPGTLRQPRQLEPPVVVASGHGQAEARPERGEVGEEHAVHASLSHVSGAGRVLPLDSRRRGEGRMEEQSRSRRQQVRGRAEPAPDWAPGRTRGQEAADLHSGVGHQAQTGHRAHTVAVHLEQIDDTRPASGQRGQGDGGIRGQSDAAAEVVAAARGNRRQDDGSIIEGVDDVVDRAVAAGDCQVSRPPAPRSRTVRASSERVAGRKKRRSTPGSAVRISVSTRSASRCPARVDTITGSVSGGPEAGIGPRR